MLRRLGFYAAFLIGDLFGFAYWKAVYNKQGLVTMLAITALCGVALGVTAALTRSNDEP